MSEAPWWQGAVIYQIYPRSFCDSGARGTGDLRGITGKLDYVASLGVDAIWLSPFFTSPMKDYGYDVSDYCDVDPSFGTLADFDALVAKAHALGLKVTIDQVYSHTSNEHPWFVESSASRDNPKADWYVWAEAKADGTPPNNWQASFGGPAWTWHPRRRQYYLHNFLTEQPDLNVRNPQVQEALLAAGRFWLDRGVDGFRLDVANYYIQDEALRDNPPAPYKRTPSRTYQFQQHLYDKSRPETLDFIARLRALTDEYPGQMMVGEIVDDDALARQIEYADGPHRLHTAYSFHLLTGGKGTPKLFAEASEACRGKAAWPAWSIGNHDVPRYPTRLGGPDAPRTQVHALLAALFALRGVIFVYQGDELGLPQAKMRFEDLKDPFAINDYTGDAGRDGARTPFPWSSTAPMAGFTQASQTWLPIDPAHVALAADTQEHDPDSTLAFTRRLIALRKAEPALRLGEARVLAAPPEVLAVLRSGAGRPILWLVNLSDGTTVFDDPSLAGAAPLDMPQSGDLAGSRFELGPFGLGVLALAVDGGS
jgi:alpha-glucosidase